VVDIVRELQMYGTEVFVCDPRADPDEALKETGIRLLKWNDLPRADAIVAAVAHREFAELQPEDIHRKIVRAGVIMDVKSLLDPETFRSAGYCLWRL
jgi:UDP-N-acetyl-D-galactosamine dehydrogenase